MEGKELIVALRKGKHVFGTAMISQSVFWPGILASIGLHLGEENARFENTV